MKKIIIIAAALTIAVSAAAQPGGSRLKFPGSPGGRPPQGMGPGGFPGDDLYNQWRSNHPMEAPKLPELELQ